MVEIGEVATGDLQNKVPFEVDEGWLRQDPPTIKSALTNRNGVLENELRSLEEKKRA